ncbi:MAG: outer membrane beta-barrel protein [Bacteroidota bacterium]
MGDKKNIDRLFREKFKHFEATPDVHVWNAIEKRLGHRKKSGYVFPLMIRYGSIAAAIALLITLGYNVDPPETLTTPQNITDTNTIENTNTNIDNTSPLLKENITNDRNNVANADNNRKNNSYNANGPVTPVKRIPVTNGDTPRPSYASAYVFNGAEVAMNTPDNGSTQRNQPGQQNNDVGENTVFSEDKKSLFDVIREENNVEEEAVAQHEASDKWSITPNAAPVYFNSLDDGSPIDNQFRDNSKSGNITISYGVNVAYQVNDRLSVRSGVNRVNYGYNTNNIEFTPALQARNISTISYKNEAENIIVTDVNTPQAPPPGSPVIAEKAVAYEGRMVQEFGYLEVPLEIKYRLLNRKLGVNVIGGVSSLFLTDNTISVQTDALNAQIGEANNINTVNFSTNVGLGIDYNLSDELRFNVEPMFKYQLNTFSNDDGGFKPYSLGVYTGLSFRF